MTRIGVYFVLALASLTLLMTSVVLWFLSNGRYRHTPAARSWDIGGRRIHFAVAIGNGQYSIWAFHQLIDASFGPGQGMTEGNDSVEWSIPGVQYFSASYNLIDNGVVKPTIYDREWQIRIHPPIPVILFGVLSALFSFCAIRRFRNASPRLDGHCQKCGYNLTSNQSGICPECGGRTVAGSIKVAIR